MEGDGSSASASFHGFVADQYDAALLVTAARLGFIPRFRRRLDTVEQRAFIHSGAVFLWNEEESYMKRWTDGYPWSPSRVQNKFLVYREMAKRGGARSRTAARLLGHSPESSADSPRRKYIRNLASSLFNKGELEYLDLQSSSGYPRSDDIFRRGGLVKKTFTIILPKKTWHVVAYYTLDDVLHDRLITPSESPALRHPRILADVMDVLEGLSSSSSKSSLFETTTPLHSTMTPPSLPLWTAIPFHNAEPRSAHVTPTVKEENENLDYHSGISDLATPQTSSSTSSPASPVSLLPLSDINSSHALDHRYTNSTLNTNASGSVNGINANVNVNVSTNIGTTGNVVVVGQVSKLEPEHGVDRGVSVMSSSSSSDSISLCSRSSWFDSSSSLRYVHSHPLPHPHPHPHPHSHHHPPRHQQHQHNPSHHLVHHPHIPLNTDLNLTIIDSNNPPPPSPVTVFTPQTQSQSPSFSVSEYPEYVEDVYKVEDHVQFNAYHNHPHHHHQQQHNQHDGNEQYYYTFQDHDQPSHPQYSADYTDTTLYSTMTTATYY